VKHHRKSLACLNQGVTDNHSFPPTASTQSVTSYPTRAAKSSTQQPSAFPTDERAGDVTVAEILKQAGYSTGIFGNWGLGEPDTTGVPNRHGFDEFFGFRNQGHAHTST
jgi:arylsulfatase A-like enzyme